MKSSYTDIDHKILNFPLSAKTPLKIVEKENGTIHMAR